MTLNRHGILWQTFSGSLFFLFFMGLATAAPEPPQLDAKSYLLIDFNSGQVIVQKDPDKRIEPASITKLMSAYVIYAALKEGQIKRTDIVTISEKAWKMGGSRMFIEVGKKVSVADLLNGMIIQSGNDATVALAEHVAGSEDYFVDLMNRKAVELGMTSSLFQNTTGWPADDHYMSTRDISILSRALIRDFPKEYELYKVKDFTFNNIPQKNRNSLLWRDDSVDGIKTGHTNAAGYCLVSSALRDNMRLIAVVVGAESEKSRADQSMSLLNYGYRFFETRQLYSAGEAIAKVRVWKGLQDEVTMGLPEPVHLTFPRGEYDQLSASIDHPDALTAPVSLAAPIGTLSIKLGDRLLYENQLHSLTAVEEAGFFKRLSDSVKSIF